MNVPGNMGVKEFHLEIETNLFTEHQTMIDDARLVYQGKQLEVGKTLHDYAVTDKSTIHMMGTLKAGAKLYCDMDSCSNYNPCPLHSADVIRVPRLNQARNNGIFFFTRLISNLNRLYCNLPGLYSPDGR